MGAIPVDSLAMLLLADALLVVALSVFLGVLAADASRVALWKGALVGLVLPLVGPAVWSVVAVAHDRAATRVRRTSLRGASCWIGVVALATAAALLAVATPMAWGEASGSVASYEADVEASSADTFLGLVATCGSIAALLVAAVLGLLTTARRRAAATAAVVGTMWLLVTVDGLLVISAFAEVSGAVAELARGQAEAEASARAGLWVTLAAAVLAVVGATVLPLSRPRDEAGAPTRTARDASFATGAGRLSGGYDYGDGF